MALVWQDYVGIVVSIIAFGGLIYLMIRKHDARLILLFIGFILLCVASWLGRLAPVNWFQPNQRPDFGTGIAILNPFYVIALEFRDYFVRAGLIIMALFGYTKFMTDIGANKVIINLLTKPLLKVQHKYLLLFLLFILGNVLSLVVPSASSLAVLLMSLLFPIMQRSKLSTLASVAIIATTATIFPTPLGSDSAFITQTLQWDLIGYTYTRLAIVALPALLVMGLVHLFWQKYLDKRQFQLQTKNNQGHLAVAQTPEPVTFANQTESQNLKHISYAILPILPIIVLLVPFVINLAFPDLNFRFGIVETIVVCTIVAIIAELIRVKQTKPVFKTVTGFFLGMGEGFSSVVVLSTAAAIFARGLLNIGVIKILTDSVANLQGASYAYLFVFAAIIMLIGTLSGSGTSTVFAFVPIVAGIANSGGLSGSEQLLVVIPIQELANLSRSFSPIAAVIIICAQQAKIQPTQILKRISVPALSAVAMVLLLSIIFFGVLQLAPF